MKITINQIDWLFRRRKRKTSRRRGGKALRKKKIITNLDFLLRMIQI